MDYEKKYNEALNDMRAIYPNLKGDAKLAVEHAFPELRESEDERIRMKLFHTVRGTPKDNEWFEEISKEAMLAWLEKQKENPKSADSIPSDCVSDAKCEDRWHKVGDSLPDNPREVLCKDEAGNYFIGRYYVGEGWEISNYDDEDKPHHLNPPVSKWIDFPSEKQKEQEHICDSTQFEEGFKTGRESGLRDGQKYVLDNAESYGLCKPAGWSEEDEKLRRNLMSLLANMRGDRITEETYQKYYPWLKSLRPSRKPSEEQEPDYYQHFDADC